MKKRKRIPKSVLKAAWLEGAQIVNGERDKETLEHGWETNPVFHWAMMKVSSMIQDYLEKGSVK